MNNNTTRLQGLLAMTLAAFSIMATPSFAALGQVTVSGSTWTGKVDGSTKYTGSSMAGAENACKNAMSSGTIQLLNSGDGNGMSTKTNVIVDGTGKTISGGGTHGILFCQNSSNIGGWNFHYTSSNWFGHYWKTVNGQNMNGSSGTANLTYRIDDCAGGLGYGLYAGSPSDSGASGSRGDNNMETYGISGTNTVGTITSNDRPNGNGYLLNYSSNFNGSANSTRCCYGCGYAAFRTANTNGKTSIGSVTGTSCGRGYFSVTASRDCTVSGIQIYTTSSHGVWLQTAYNTHVNSGTVRHGNPCSSISAGSGNSISVSCQ